MGTYLEVSMRLFILDKKGLAIVLCCLMVTIMAIGILTNTGMKAVQTATEQKELPIYSVETDKKQVAILYINTIVFGNFLLYNLDKERWVYIF